MDTVRRISRNIFFQGASEVISKGLQVLVMIYIARLLQSAEFGKFNFAIAFTTITLIFLDFGLQQLFIRDLSRERGLAEKYVFHSIILKSAVSLLGFAAVIFIMNAMKYPDDIRILVYLMFTYTILKSFTDVLSSVFLAFEEMQYDSVLKITRSSILTILIFLVLFTGKNLLLIGWMYIFTEIAVLSLCAYFVFAKFIKFVAKIEGGLMKKITYEASPFALTLLFYSIYFYIDSIMLSKMRGIEEVGIYSAAYNITTALVFVPMIYTTAIFPILSRYHYNSSNSLEFAYKKSLLYMSMASLPVACILFFVGSNIIHFLYGAGYGRSVIVLEIIAVTIVFRFVSYLNAIVLISVEKQKQRLYIQLWTALVNIALNLYAIPKYGYIGAAYSTVITEFFLFAAYFKEIVRHFHNLQDIIFMFRPVSAIIISLLAFFLEIPTLAQILLFLGLYVALIAALKIFDKKDMEIFRRVLRSASKA